MTTTWTAITALTLGGALLVGCETPGSGVETPAGSPGTGTNVPMNNTPGLSGTGTMAPANRGTDTRTRVDDNVDAGVIPPPPRAPSTRPTNVPPQPRGNAPTTAPATQPSVR